MPRLNTHQFLALRSIAREPWDMLWRRIQWRFNGKWFYLFQRYGVRAPLDSVDGIGGRCGYGDVYERAWAAAWELDEMGLVEVVTERCCPGMACHRNDRHEFRLTLRGNALLQKASAVGQKASADPTPVEIPKTVVSPTGGSWWRKTASLLERLRA